ncbi:hypothetical protein S40293_05636 [Stachybotrys chartarum IBT 40293]|nr:hypothetical protein S40293_05636 [Stachybotrys chartarum IBT 40293]
MDNKSDAETVTGAAAKHQQQTPPQPTMQDVDEFGLPLKRFPAPEIDTNAADSAQENTDAKPPAATNPAGPGKAEKHAEAAIVEPPPDDGKTVNTDSDDDSDQFKDAPTEPLEVKGEASQDTLSVRNQNLTPEAGNDVTRTQPAPDGDTSSTTETVASKEPQSQASKATLEPLKAADAVTSSTEPTPSVDQKHPAHSRNTSIATSHGDPSASGFSHQQLSTQEESKHDDADDGWQEMPSYARYDMYDDDDRLIAREYDEAEVEKYGYGGLGGAGKGYTRVMIDDDAESATSMDENTQYLFNKEGKSTSMVDDSDARDAVSQMQATKDLLTEGQRIAYVGVVRLEIANMVKAAEAVEMTKRSKKMVATATEAMRMWGQMMMIRLYAHMDISEAEQLMIEQLAEHGLVAGDLTPALHANSRVKNPMAEPRNSASSPSVTSPSTPGLGDEKPAEVPPPYESISGEDMPEVKTPSQLPTTEKIDIDLRWTVLCDLFLILVADSVYDARSRTLMEKVAESLEIAWIDICRFEKRVTDALEMQQAAEKENWNEEDHLEHRRKAALKKRYVMMGLATVGGGLVIGLSAGLAAPLIGAGLAAGFGAIGISGTTGFLAGAGGAAIITSGAAASGGYIGVKAAHRRTGAVKTFEYRPLHNNKRVNLIVTVSGWLTGKMDDVRLPYSTVDPIMGDIYSVLWEPEMLKSMGDTINILATEALTQGLQQILASTVLMGLMGALQIPIILTKLAYLIDNPWTVSLDRATAAGLILADSLMERSLGARPITLLGYSLGSRVIFSCLQELAKKGAYGLVQNVYMFGSPVVVKKDEYLRAKTVVSGRFVNGYNRSDWILGYLFRLTSGGISRIAGLAPIEGLPWLENVDVTELVPGHLEYRTAMPSLLMKVGWQVESDEFTEIEDPDPENHKDRQRELISEIEEARRALEKEGKSGKSSRFSFFGRRKKGERQDWEVYEDKLGKENAAKEQGQNQGQGDGDGPEARNQGVLFDVDAIRAELAKGAPEDAAEEFQVREIKSTLPPMKIDMPSTSSLPMPTSAHRGDLRETRSSETLPVRSSTETRSLHLATPTQLGSRTPVTPMNGRMSHEEDEIQMTFDTAFDDRRDDGRNASPLGGENYGRPEMKTARTLPNMTLSDPWGDPDDEDFGKEKEISMTFA